MESTFIIVITFIVFLALIFWYYKTLNKYIKNECGKNRWKLLGGKFFFWEGAIFFSTTATVVFLCIFKCIAI